MINNLIEPPPLSRKYIYGIINELDLKIVCAQSLEFGRRYFCDFKSITDFFMSDKFIGNVDNLFELVNLNPVEEIEYKSDSNSDIFLKVTSMMANGKFVMICQDVTQAHNYNTLILTEKQKTWGQVPAQWLTECNVIRGPEFSSQIPLSDGC